MGRLSNVEKAKRATVPVQPPPESNPTRPEIARMSGSESLDDLASKIPADTSTGSGEPSARKPRKNKTAPDDNPLLQDKRYSEAVANMGAFGGAKTVKAAFTVTKKPLDSDEEKEVEDFFYVVSRQYSLDPAKSPWFMLLFGVVMILRLFAVRMMGTTTGAMWSGFAGIFGEEKKETTKAVEAEEETIA